MKKNQRLSSRYLGFEPNTPPRRGKGGGGGGVCLRREEGGKRSSYAHYDGGKKDYGRSKREGSIIYSTEKGG